jgi:hypothetical protein
MSEGTIGLRAFDALVVSNFEALRRTMSDGRRWRGRIGFGAGIDI